MVILAILVVYAVAKLISLVANVIHVRLDISTFLHAMVKLLIHICTHITPHWNDDFKKIIEQE